MRKNCYRINFDEAEVCWCKCAPADCCNVQVNLNYFEMAEKHSIHQTNRQAAHIPYWTINFK